MAIEELIVDRDLDVPVVAVLVPVLGNRLAHMRTGGIHFPGPFDALGGS